MSNAMAVTTLTPRRERFAQCIASGMSQADAYRASFSVERSTAKTIQEAASRLMKDSKIRARLDELRAPIVKNVQVTLENHLRDLMALRNLATKEKQMSAAINAEIARGKACGLYVEKLQHSNPDGTLRPQVIKIIAA